MKPTEILGKERRNGKFPKGEANGGGDEDPLGRWDGKKVDDKNFKCEQFRNQEAQVRHKF